MGTISYLKALLLGLFQGFTEFLPVSSSGHIMIIQEWLNVDMEGGALGLFTVLLHVGTLVAVLWVYRKTVWQMICHPVNSDLKWLIAATIPTVAYTLILKALDLDDKLEASARALLPWAFFTTAIFLFLADKLAEYHAAGKTTHKRVRLSDAIVMGLMQCVGTITGVSRSGSTITGGLAMGLNRKRAADFSFLMSIPAILGAVALEGIDLIQGEGAPVGLSESALPVALGVLAAMLSGLVAIKFMLFVIRKIHLKWFAVYVGLLAMAILVKDYLF